MQWNNLPRLCNELVSFDLPHGTSLVVLFFFPFSMWGRWEGALTLSSLTRVRPESVNEDFFSNYACEPTDTTDPKVQHVWLFSLNKPCQNWLEKLIYAPFQVCLGTISGTIKRCRTNPDKERDCCIITIYYLFMYLFIINTIFFSYKKISFSLCCHNAKSGPKVQPLNMISKMPPGWTAVQMRYWSSYSFVLFQFLQPLLLH